MVRAVRWPEHQLFQSPVRTGWSSGGAQKVKSSPARAQSDIRLSLCTACGHASERLVSSIRPYGISYSSWRGIPATGLLVSGLLARQL